MFARMVGRVLDGIDGFFASDHGWPIWFALVTADLLLIGWVELIIYTR